MKYLILSMFIAVSTSSFAQSWEVGVNGGVANYTLRGAIGLNVKVPSAVADYSVKLARNTADGRWQYGLSADVVHFSYSYEDWGDIFTYNPNTYVTNGGRVAVPFAAPAVPIKLFANRKAHWGRTELYGGFSVGYVYVQPNSPATDGSKHGNGQMAGAVLGAARFVTERLGLNAEFNYSRLDLTTTQDHSLNIGSATVGVHYRFGGALHKKAAINTTN